MKIVIEAIQQTDVEKINHMVDTNKLVNPLLYNELISSNILENNFSLKTLALYACEPLQKDLILGSDCDPYSPNILNRFESKSLSVKGVRWFYDLFKSDESIYVKLTLVEPFKSSQKSEKSEFPSDMAWMLSLVSDYVLPPRTEAMLLLQELWMNGGDLTEYADSTLSQFVIFPVVVIYFLFYFMDVLPNAEKSFLTLLTNIDDKIIIDARFYIDLVAKYPDISCKALDNFSIALINPSRKDIKPTPQWTDEDIGRLIYTSIEKGVSPKHWIEFLPIESSIQTKLFKVKTSLEFTDQFISLLWKDGTYQVVRDVIKAAPISVFQHYMKNQQHPILVITGMYNRGFHLDDTCLYLFKNHDGYVMTRSQLDDFLMRFRGSKKGLDAIIKYELETIKDVTSCFWLGVLYQDEKLLKCGSSLIQENGYTIYTNDDILVKVSKDYIEKCILRYFPMHSVYYHLLHDELKRLYVPQI